MLSDLEKSSLTEILNERGFEHINGKGQYVFSGGRKAVSPRSLYNLLGFPESLDSKDLHRLANQYRKAKDLGQFWAPFFDLMKDWSDNHQPTSTEVLPNTLDTSLFSDEDQAEDPTTYIQSLVPAVNITANAKDQIILLDPHRDHRPVLEIDPQIYLALMKKDALGLIADDSILKVLTVFDPYTLKSLFIKESSKGALKTWHVNYYVPPRWRFVEAEPAFTGFIKKLIEHLFPLADEREYVLDWLHYAIVSRNETVLCLIGARGTGKGILLKDILSMLIGLDYREIVNQEILTDKFNAAFKNRRYVFFDEVNVSGDRELNKFKAFCNSTIVLEEKGQDSETIDNYTSLGLSSNDKKDFKAEPQERRFSVPEVTDKPLLDVYTEEEINNFISDISEPESKTLAAFGNFLLQRKPKHTSRRPLKGKYFFNLCRLSMPEWKSYIIEYVMHEGVPGEHILVSNLTKKFKKIHGENAPFATKRGSIETFLGDYYHEGQCRVGRIVDAWDAQRGRDTFAIVPDEDFLAKFGTNKNVSAEEGGDALDAL